MFWLKGCPRCGGDLHKETDQFGAYFACLQCGYYRDLPAEPLGPKGRGPQRSGSRGTSRSLAPVVD